LNNIYYQRIHESDIKGWLPNEPDSMLRLYQGDLSLVTMPRRLNKCLAMAGKWTCLRGKWVEFWHGAFTVQGPLVVHMLASLQTLSLRSLSWLVSSQLTFPSATSLLICKEVALDSLAARSTLFPPVTHIKRNPNYKSWSTGRTGAHPPKIEL
jgi:hypothetical protein